MSDAILKTAHRVFEIEIEALQAVEKQLGDEFVELVERSKAALSRGGKLVLTGVGKSGYIGKKISATLSSIGSTAVFMHPVEALHGDLGIMRKDDLLNEINKGTSKPHGTLWHNTGRFLYVFCALTLCLVALCMKVAF